jgi:hypothetical protein
MIKMKTKLNYKNHLPLLGLLFNFLLCLYMFSSCLKQLKHKENIKSEKNSYANTSEK